MMYYSLAREKQINVINITNNNYWFLNNLQLLSSFRKLQILILQTADFYFANYRFSFRKLQIFISFRSISFRSISFRKLQ